VQIGRIFLQSPRYPLWDTECRPQLDYLKRCAEAKVAASDYLSLGEFMRPPVIETPLPTVETDYRRAHTVMPAVLVRAWKAPSGNVAHVLTNITPVAQTVTYRFSTDDYAFPEGSSVRCRQIFPPRPQPDETFPTAECRRTIRLDGHDVRVFELSRR